MLIIIDDKMQGSDAPSELISPALSDTYTDTLPVAVDLGASYTVNAIGIGYTDATTVTISDGGTYTEVITLGTGNEKTGLYEIPTLTEQNISITHNGTYIGRVALGFSRSLGAAPTREIGFFTTQSNRITASGQVIPGTGGYNGRRVSIDTRYKIDSDIWDDIEISFPLIAKGYPWFVKFSDKELNRFPWQRLYCAPNDT